MEGVKLSHYSFESRLCTLISIVVAIPEVSGEFVRLQSIVTISNIYK